MKYRSISKNNKPDIIYKRVGFKINNFERPNLTQCNNFKDEFSSQKLNSFLNFLNLLNFFTVLLRGQYRDSRYVFGGMGRW